jgi:DNA-binding NarL/FixJ family response regulator
VAAGLAVTGGTARALAVARKGFQALETVRQVVQPAFARVVLAQAEIMALCAAGQLRALEDRAGERHRRNLAVPEWAGDDVTCLQRAWPLLAGGGPRPALRWLNEALAGFDRGDPVGLGPVCRSLWSMASALTGDPAAAREVLRDADSTAHPAIRLFDPIARQAESWVAAAGTRREDAAALATEGARLAAEQGQWVTEAVLLHDVVRFGGGVEVLGRLQELAAELDSPLVRMIAARAAAGVPGSAERLEAIGHQFQASGALLYGADAEAQAARLYERHGDRRAAAAATARAMALAHEGGAAEPAVVDVPQHVLTEREEQVAGLAARGLSNLAIADRLVLSVRTVEAHLARAYGKFGISRRSELAAAMTLARPRSGRLSPLELLA